MSVCAYLFVDPPGLEPVNMWVDNYISDSHTSSDILSTRNSNAKASVIKLSISDLSNSINPGQKSSIFVLSAPPSPSEANPEPVMG
jgi:hypothetical protein